MADPIIREYLIGYLLGALDKDEQQLVEESLAVDENLRRELGLMSRALAPLDSAFEEHAPPPNLIAKTCEMVDAYREGILSEETAEEPAHVEFASTKPTLVEAILAEPISKGPATIAEPLTENKVVKIRSQEAAAASADHSKPTGTRRRMHPASAVPRAKVTDWRWQDLAVSALVIGLILITLVPGLLGRREDARVLTCQNNLQSLSHSLTNYSEHNEGFFPPIPTSGKMSVASAFAPILASAELLPNPRVLLCPGSILCEKFFSEKLLDENLLSEKSYGGKFAGEKPVGEKGFRVPSSIEIAQIDSPDELLKIQETMGGSYGYSLGYHQDGTYRPTKNLRRSYFAVLSDSPGNLEANYQPNHHGGRGQNVLFEDGHVLFITQARTAGGRDNLFLNDANLIAAGLHPNDAVIAAGAVHP